MFGSLATDEKDEKACKDGMTLGILPDTLKYLALRDIRLSEDLAASRLIKGSGILDLRIPLISSYSAKNENGLPPQPGRPKSEGITSEGQEQDLDGGE